MKRLMLFLLGLILFLTSLPIGSKMIMELIHNQRMVGLYTITNVSKGFPPTDTTFYFNDHTVEIEETIKESKSYIDPYKFKIGIADLSVKVDGKVIDTLKEYPIRIEEEGLNRYYGELAYLTLEDKKKDKTQFIVLLKKTRELKKEMPNGDIVGSVSDEKLMYSLYALDEGGSLSHDSFSFTKRNALQTELLNAGNVGPHTVGYYTDAWEGIPTLFFPFIFPFLTLIVGFILLFFFFPYRKKYKSL
ncbi:hypothetical protein ACH0B5_13650 [Ureibacillus sp. 179-F W5.1 NHS]|uniref:hypothetical protein n=1 Tax=unclassified Ureibacillus TaxID=2638520 RepID=UPI003119C060